MNKPLEFDNIYHMLQWRKNEIERCRREIFMREQLISSITTEARLIAKQNNKLDAFYQMFPEHKPQLTEAREVPPYGPSN